MNLSVLEYLKHILDEADYLKQNSNGLVKDKFLKDETLKRAFVRSAGNYRRSSQTIARRFAAKLPANRMAFDCRNARPPDSRLFRR